MALKQILITLDDKGHVIEAEEQPINSTNEHELPTEAPLNLSAMWGIDERTNRVVMRWEIEKPDPQI